MSVTVTVREFGRLPDGTAADLFTLRNDTGTEVSLSSWGGIITSIRTPDRHGTVSEITLAHKTLEEYLKGHPYYGALVGRVCNRVSGGGFTLEGTRYSVPANLGTLHLHGGVRGFDKRLYASEVNEKGDEARVRLSRTSPDGEEGYPGSLSVVYTVGLTDDNRLIFEFEAETDKTTVVNMTNHCYWNLSGEPTILDHEVTLAVDTVVEADQNAVPTGRFLPVANTPFDFSEWKRIRPGFDALRNSGINGYDHSLAITGAATGDMTRAPREMREAVRVRAPRSGRMMSVHTTYPDLHFYTGNNLPGQKGRRGETLNGQEALCLECQFFPDAPNRPEFPSISLRRGEHYHHLTEHRFTTF